MKDLTTYALAYTAALVAALAVAGVLGASLDLAKPADSQVSVAGVQAHTPVVTTMNIPF